MCRNLAISHYVTCEQLIEILDLLLPPLPPLMEADDAVALMDAYGRTGSTAPPCPESESGSLLNTSLVGQPGDGPGPDEPLEPAPPYVMSTAMLMAIEAASIFWARSVNLDSCPICTQSSPWHCVG